MVFEWDKAKALNNFKKHKIFFNEAASIFGDPLAVTFNDPDHSVGEHRYLTFGLSRINHLLVVAHTAEKGRIRIISARLMSKQERKIYEQI